jgi:hypothetical protein
MLFNLEELFFVFCFFLDIAENFYELVVFQDQEKDGLPNNLEDMLPNGSPVPMRSSDVSGTKKMSSTSHAKAKLGW